MSLGILSGSQVLVTGGAGFIGSHVTEALLSLGPSRVTVLDSLVRGSSENLRACERHSAFSFVQGDVRDQSLVESCMEGVRYCLHFAAPKVPYCEQYPAEATDILVRGTLTVAEAARKCGVLKIVFPSSVLVYGSPSRIPTPETEPPYSAETVYAAGKLYGEQLLHAYYRRHGLRSVIVRYFNVYGPRMNTNAGDAEVMIKWMHALSAGTVPKIHGDGSSTLDLVHVRDAVTATVSALLGDIEHDRINVASGTEVSLRELLSLVCSAKGVPVPHYEVGGASHAGNISRRCADITKASRLLGYVPRVSLQDGIKELAAWFATQNVIDRKIVGVF